MLWVMLLPALAGFSQSSAASLDVVSWNIEWFGASFEDPADDALQEARVGTILRHLDADIYGLVEVVDTARLRRVTQTLGPQFAYVIAPYASGNSTGMGNAWLNAQKLAFIYNRDVFSQVQARGLMRNSGPAYANWASGRFPFLFSAVATINGISRPVNFILLHGKAGATISDYNRRIEGVQELKDTLDAYFSNTANIIIGDYNDGLYRTICTACGTPLSSYDPIIGDSTDADHYRSVTLPLGAAGQSSMTNFPNVVDNHVISNEAALFYVPQSARIRHDVAGVVPNYATTVSDHYPVFSQYNLGLATAIPSGPQAEALQVRGSMTGGRLLLHTGSPIQNGSLLLTDWQGRQLAAFRLERTAAGTTLQYPLPPLQRGIYLLHIRTNKGVKILKLMKDFY